MRPVLRIQVGRGRRLRRRAAALALERRDLATAAPEVAEELIAMQALVRTLEALPQQAWESELGPAPQLRTLGEAAGRRFRSQRARERPSWSRGLGGVAAAACLGAAFLVGALTHPWAGTVGSRPPGSSTAQVVLTPLAGSSSHGRAVAYMLGGGSRMRLRLEHLPRSRPGTYYELWLMTSATDLVSVSSFRVGAAGSGVLNLILPDDPSRYRYLDISVQRVGAGSAISSHSVLRGPIPA